MGRKSVSQSGLQHFHPRKKPRSSKMSLSWYSRDELACATSSSTKVATLNPKICIRNCSHTTGRFQGSLPTLCLPLLHCRLCIYRQWAHHSRNRAPLRGTDGQILWQRVRAWHNLQFSKGLLHTWRTTLGWWNAGEQQEKCAKMHKPTRQSWRHGGKCGLNSGAGVAYSLR